MNRLPETSKRVRAIQKRYHYALEVLEDSSFPSSGKRCSELLSGRKTNGSQTSALKRLPNR